MDEKIHENNTNMLHLFEKIKYIVAIANKSYRKDRHYGFNLWRNTCRNERKVENILENSLIKVIPRHLTREYFKKWNTSARLYKRLHTASILLEEF
jgi:hypothetical protein